VDGSPDDIEARFRELNGDVASEVVSVRSQALTIAAGWPWVVIAIAFLAGRRGGRKRSTVGRSAADLNRWEPSTAHSVGAFRLGFRRGVRGQSIWFVIGTAAWLLLRHGSRPDEVVYRTVLKAGETLVVFDRRRCRAHLSGGDVEDRSRLRDGERVLPHRRQAPAVPDHPAGRDVVPHPCGHRGPRRLIGAEEGATVLGSPAGASWWSVPRSPRWS